MTNTQLLRREIKKSGLKLKMIMKVLGIKSYTTMRDKINNVKNFTIKEVEILCVLLNLTPEQREQIFFAQETELDSVAEGA